jgi:hypothetical protein
MKWFDANPHGPNPGLRGEIMWEVHEFGRNTFPSSFSRGGGFVSTAFAPTAKEAFVAPWRGREKFGSPQHITNLRRMQAADPKNLNITQALAKAEKGSGKVGMLKRAGQFGLGAAFVAVPMFTTPGGLQEKARATAGGLAGYAGWELGSKAGMGIGAAVGSIIPGLGTTIGGAVGYIAGGFAGAIGADEGFQALSRIPDRMVEGERARRNLNWRGDPTAFMTRQAHTMRQQSLQAMNRGQMTARSMLGREGVMLHQ